MGCHGLISSSCQSEQACLLPSYFDLESKGLLHPPRSKDIRNPNCGNDDRDSDIPDGSKERLVGGWNMVRHEDIADPAENAHNQEHDKASQPGGSLPKEQSDQQATEMTPKMLKNSSKRSDGAHHA